MASLLLRTCCRASAAASAPRRALSSSSSSAATALAAKRTTGVVGLDVEADARGVLMALYSKTLHDVRALLPEHAAYRKDVELMTGFRLDVVRATPDVAEIEAKIGRGQVEELVAQAKSELQLIPEYAQWRLWDSKPPAREDDVAHDEIYGDFERLGEPLGGPLQPLRPLALAKQRELQARESERAKAAAEAAAAAAAAAAAKAKAAADAAAAAAAPAAPKKA
jgi:NADH dehydrogenase (ubiquinone) 1 alpha subcomplex subunit 5